MKYLVTGGAGFIGSHLVERLLESGEVIVWDDFSTGKWENMPEHPNLTPICESILDPCMSGFFNGVDIVFHLAALTRPQESIVSLDHYNNVNVIGTLRVLTACRDNNVKRVVFASSASIYGQQDKMPSLEEHKPNPMSPYALQKYIGEQYCQLFESIYGLETNCLRLFNVFGDRMNPDGSYASLIPKFIKLIRRNEQPPIYGTGFQARDFIYIDDVVNAFLAAAQSEAHGEVFNVGSEKTYSVRLVFELLRTRLKNNIDAVFEPAVIEPDMTLADCGKAHKLLGWFNETSLSEGIDKVMECY